MINHPIANIVCEHFGLAPDEIDRKTNLRRIVDARHLAMTLIYTYSPKTDRQIATMFGKDRSNMTCARRKITWFVKKEVSFYRDILACEQKVIQLVNSGYTLT